MSSVVGRVLLFVLAGLAAGLFTWFISDGSHFIRLSDTVVMTKREAIAYQVIFMTWGGSIGVFLGLADMLLAGTTGQWPRVVGVGLAVGIAAGVVGGAFGMTFFGPLYVTHAGTPFDFLRNVIARAIGWAFIGALAGTASGWRKLSLRVGRNGLIGGFIGGILGGATFEIIPYLMPGLSPGPVSRFFGFLITGGMIGLFIALVQELLKEAWVRVVVGRNEGREILIEKVETKIGRSELSDVALFGDPNVARTHAVLIAQPDGRYLLRDVSESPVGVRVNEEPMAGERLLRSGDRIQIAGRNVVFYERLTRERTAPAPKDVAAPRPRPMPVGVGGGLPSLSDLPAAGTPMPPPRPMPSAFGTSALRLVATAGPYTGTSFPASPGAVIGRDPAVQIPLPADSKASRTHARLVTDAGGGVAVEDNDSTNGTFVNGQRVSYQAIVPGDTIVIGTTSFRLE